MTQTEFADLAWRGRPVRIEHRWISRERRDRPLLVFLHEGLGSVAAWKDFPRRLCRAAKVRGLVYSRPNYGRSTRRPDTEPWTPDFLHEQAHVVLPELLAVLDVRERVWLFGHSDGASIALLHAARFPESVAGAIVLAPHIFVEAMGQGSIRKLRADYLDTDLKSRLARYHDDADASFWAWNRIWLDPAFESWTIESELARISCPLLAIQGQDDEYGTLAQIHGIARRVPEAQLLELADCRHRAHRDQPERVLEAAARFIAEQQKEHHYHATG